MYQKERPGSIRTLFDSIAPRYDVTNAVLSFALHKRWNQALAQQLSASVSATHTLVDLCSGTGDIAFAYLKQTSFPCHAYLIDFSSGMLQQAQKKASGLSFEHDHALTYTEADVHTLPLPNQTADCVAMAYGIRNVRDPASCMQEVFRILKPGGCFGVLELTRPRHPILRWGHCFYLQFGLPLIGKWLTHNPQAYTYLCQSIQNFIEPAAIKSLLQTVGFDRVAYQPLTGGIATLFIARKPSPA